MMFRYESRLEAEGYRQQGLAAINWGMTLFANGLKLVSAVLIVLGGQSTDRWLPSFTSKDALVVLGGQSMAVIYLLISLTWSYWSSLADNP